MKTKNYISFVILVLFCIIVVLLQTISYSLTMEAFFVTSRNFNIHGEGGIITTYSDNGYTTVLKVGDNTVNVVNSEGELDSVKCKTYLSYVSNGNYVKVEYSVTNNSSISKTVGVGTWSDIMINKNDRATVTNITGNKGFSMSDGTQYTFNFLGRDAYGVTNVDTYWFGAYGQQESNIWNSSNIDKLENTDSAMAFSWKNRTLEPNETQKYSVVIGVGTLNSPPTITVNSPTKAKYSPNDTISVQGTVNDVDSGDTVQVKYAFDGNNETLLNSTSYTPNGVAKNYTGTIQIPAGITRGNHFIDVWAVDNNGNMSASQKINFFVETDHIPPTMSYVLEPSEWTNQNVKIKVTAQDDISGVKKIKLPNETEVNSTTAEYEATESNTYKFYVEDNAGNSKEYDVVVDKIERVIPTISVTPQSTEWTNKDINVSVTGSDEGGSQFKSYKYKVTDNSETPQSYETEESKQLGTITVTGEGEKYIHIVGYDNAGNESEKRYFGTYKIDTTEPNVQVNAELNEHVIDSLKISIHSTDSLSGIKSVKFNGQKLEGTENTSETVDTNGTYTLEVEDNAGNVHSEQVVITNIYQHCTAGLGHPDYPSDVDKCPVCGKIEGLRVTKTTETYNAQEQHVTYVNPQESTIVEYYNGRKDVPVDVGSYIYDLKISYNGEEYNTGRTGTFTITKKNIGIENIVAGTRAYNGTKEVDLSGGNLIGVEEADRDKVDFELPSIGTATSKDVGTRNVSIPQITLTGVKAGNYQLTKPEQEDVQVEITQKNITIQGITATNRQYNGTTNVELQGGELVGIEQIDIGKVRFILSEYGTISNKDVGNYEVTIPEISLTGGEAKNYKLTQPSSTDVRVQITKKDIRIQDIKAINREYNGTNVVEITGGKLVGVEAEDASDVSFTMAQTGTTSDSIIGEYDVTIPEIVLTGDEAKNYNLIQPKSSDVKVEITAKHITIEGITATNRQYNGTNIVEISGGTLVGVNEEDSSDVVLNMPQTGNTSSKDVGEYGVTIPKIVLTGDKAKNYNLTQPTNEEVRVEITQKEITIQNITSTNRQYNGTTDVEIQGGELVGIEQIDIGRVDFILPQIGTIPSKNIGEYGVTIPTIALTGREAKNYKLIQPTNEEFRVEISKKDITIENIVAQDREYDSTKDVNLSGGNLVGIEEVDEGKVEFTLPETGTIPKKDVGKYYVEIPEITLSGEEAENYNLIQPGGNEVYVNITKKTMQNGEVKIENIIPQDRQYDGTKVVELKGGEITGIEESDIGKVGFILPPTGTIESKNVGTYNVSIPEITLTGEEAKNYQLTQPGDDEFTVTISKREVSLQYVKGEDRQYNKTKIVNIRYGKLLNVIGKEKVQPVVAKQGIAESEHVGKWIVEIPEITLTGKDIDNYELIPVDPTDITVNILKPNQPDLHVEAYVSKVNEEKVNNTSPVANTKVDLETKGVKVDYRKGRLDKKIRYNDKFEITIRVYNEGKGAGYAQKIINEIPEGTEFLEDEETNKQNEWKKVSDRKYETEILNFDSGVENEIDAAVTGKVDYREVTIALIVTNAKRVNKEVKNITYTNAVDIENEKALEEDPTAKKELPIIEMAEAEAGWKNQDKTITVEAKDEGNNGIAGYAITKKDKEPKEWEASSETTWTSTQQYDNGTYYAWVKDAAGNVSNSKKVIVDKVDKVNPKIKTFERDMLTLKGVAEDNESGIAEYQFSTEQELTESSEGWKSIYSPAPGEIEKTQTVDKAGEYYFYVKDLAGNISKSETSIVVTAEEVNSQIEKKISVDFKYFDSAENQEKTETVEGIILAGRDTTIVNAPESKTTNVDIFGNIVTVKPRGWSTQETPEADIEIDNGGSVELTENDTNKTYYMSYEYVIRYGVNTKDLEANRAKREEKQMKIHINSKGETTADEQKLDLPQISNANRWEFVGWTKGDAKPNSETIDVNTEKPDSLSITEYHASYKKDIVVERYIYKNQKVTPTINGEVYQNDIETVKAKVKLGTIDSITISENADGVPLGKTETAEPRGWSTSPSMYALIEVPSSEDQEIELEEDATYYASYSFRSKFTFLDENGDRVEEEGDTNVDYLGNVEISEEKEAKFPDLPEAPEGWSPKGWVEGDDPTKEPVDPEGTPKPNTDYYATYEKKVTLDRYVYKRNSLEQLKGTAYKNSVKEVPAEFNLGTADNVQIKTKSNGESLKTPIEASPRVWSTSPLSNAEDTSASNSESTVNESSVALNGKAHLINSATYYMSYTYNFDVTYNEGSEDKNKNVICNLGYDNSITGNAFDLQDPQVPTEWGLGWETNGWIIGDGDIDVDGPERPTTFEPETEYNAGFKKEVTISFDANGGNNPVPDSQTKYKYKTAKKESTVSIQIPTSNLPTKDKCSLLGFDENRGVSTANYKVGKTYEFADTTTLYAIWQLQDESAPNISFDPDGNTVWAKSQATTVTVIDDTEIPEGGIKYTWTSSSYQPDESEFTQVINSNDQITKDGETGEYYAWVMATDTSGNVVTKSSRAFCLDNKKPEMLSLTVGGVSSEGGIELIGKAQDTNSGIVAYQFSKNADITDATPDGWNEIGEATTDTTTQKATILTSGIWYFYVKDAAGNYNRSQIEISDGNYDILKPTITYTPSQGWTREVEVTITYPNVEGLEKKYTRSDQDESEKTYADPFKVRVNNTIITAKSKLGEIEIEADPATITNIDDEEPDIANISTGSISDDKKGIELIGVARDTRSGIIAYQFSQDSTLTAETETGWQTLDQATTESKTLKTTISTKGTWYLYVKDAVGNYSKKAIEVTDSNFNSLKPIIQLTPGSGWTREVNVTITYPDVEGLEKKYTRSDQGDTEETYNESFKVRQNNTTITAKSKLGDIEVEATPATITNIDDINPDNMRLYTGGISSDKNGIDLFGIAQDKQSGVKQYQFSQSADITADTPEGWQTIEQVTAGSVTERTTISTKGTWYFYVKDAVGNFSKTQLEVTDNNFEVLKPIIKVTPETEWTREVTVTITYPEVNGLEKIYTKGGGEERYTEQFTIIDNNTTITAKSKLGDIEIEADPVTISNIDREGPEELIIDGNTENASVTFRAKDSKSGVDKIKIEYEGKTLVATYTYKTGWFSSGIIMQGYAYQGVNGLWGKGPIKFYAIDKLGNTSETADEDWNAVDSSPPVIEFVSAVPEGTANCPYCDEHPASGKIRLTFNLVSEEGTGLYDYSGTPYISIIKENTEDEINGHFKYITMPEKGAKTGQFVAEMYIHGATSADYSGHINNLTVLDMYGNQSNPIQFEYNFGS